MKYDELVKALRLIAKEQDCNECEAGRWHHDFECCLFDDAADAVEALQDTVQAQDKALKECARQLAKMGPKQEEVWKDVIGYEGLYQVSDQARVRNNKGKILKQSVKVGKCVYYKYVKLYKDGQYRQGYIHRMMAECFLPNPNNLPIINHKDEDGTNNRLDNLEWCTVEYNSNYGNAKRNMSRGKRRAGRRWRCRMDRNKEYQYITEDEVWERFVIVRRIWMKYNGREPQEDMDGERREG